MTVVLMAPNVNTDFKNVECFFSVLISNLILEKEDDTADVAWDGMFVVNLRRGGYKGTTC